MAMNVFQTANRLLQLNQVQLSKSLERLSSAKRINRASDDAAGAAIVQLLTGQINGSSVALNNVQDGVGALNIADGGLSTITGDLQRIRELTVQAASDTMSPEARDAIAQEISQLSANIDQVANSTSFNGQQLLDGTANMNLQVGPNSGDTINVTVDNAETDLAAGGIGLFDSGGTTTFTDAADLAANLDGASARAFLADIDNAIANVNTSRANVGASVNQLNSAASNLSVSIENTSAARSRIQDTDIASEMSLLIQAQILSQAGVSVLAQAKESSANFARNIYQ